MTQGFSKEGAGPWRNVGAGESHGRSVDQAGELTADELEAEATHIEDDSVLAEQPTNIIDEGTPPPQLLVEHGRDKGKTYVLNPGETSIGRGIDNEVILTDVTVSRKHLKIQHENGVLTLRDLGSGNGTLVNGQAAFEVKLRRNDKIRIGDTTLVVIDGSVKVQHQSNSSGATPNPHAATVRPAMYGFSRDPASHRSNNSVVVPKSWLVTMTIVGGLILVSLGVTVAVLWLQRVQYTPVTESARDSIAKDLQQGEAALNAGNLDEAEKHLTHVLLRYPDHGRAIALMQRVQQARQQSP